MPFLSAALSTSLPMRPNPAHRRPKSQYVGLPSVYAEGWHTEFEYMEDAKRILKILKIPDQTETDCTTLHDRFEAVWFYQ